MCLNIVNGVESEQFNITSFSWSSDFNDLYIVLKLLFPVGQNNIVLISCFLSFFYIHTEELYINE